MLTSDEYSLYEFNPVMQYTVQSFGPLYCGRRPFERLGRVLNVLKFIPEAREAEIPLFPPICIFPTMATVFRIRVQPISNVV